MANQDSFQVHPENAEDFFETVGNLERVAGHFAGGHMNIRAQLKHNEEGNQGETSVSLGLSPI
eukprot:15432055-Alexandrium_andersonii.AAC.1